MSASDNLQGGQFYHGTATNPQIGDAILPVAQKTWMKPSHPQVTDTKYAYATPDADTAWHYAELSWHNRSTGRPRVFQVEPMGDHEADPSHDEHGQSRGNFSQDRRSQAGWRVLNEVQMPEHMGSPEDWR